MTIHVSFFRTAIANGLLGKLFIRRLTSIVKMIIWATLKPSTQIVAACLPTLGPLLQHRQSSTQLLHSSSYQEIQPCREYFKCGSLEYGTLYMYLIWSRLEFYQLESSVCFFTQLT